MRVDRPGSAPEKPVQANHGRAWKIASLRGYICMPITEPTGFELDSSEL